MPTKAVSPTADEKLQPESFAKSTWMPTATASGGSPIVPRKWSATPAQNEAELHTMKACGEGGVGLVQKTTALDIILPSKSLNWIMLSNPTTSEMLTIVVSAAKMASTIRGSHWLASENRFDARQA